MINGETLRWRKLWPLAFWATMFACYVLAITPLPVPELGPQPDKVNHILAFMTLAMLGRLAYPLRPRARLVAGLAAFGALIEITQMVPALNRSPDWRDWMADVVAVGFGLVLHAALLRSYRAVSPS
jgi:hypothetical protein